MTGKVKVRKYAKGIGEAVADRTINRKIEVNGKQKIETWADVAARVARGNSLLEPREDKRTAEEEQMFHHLAQASVLMSGRHLQHGDESQPTRNQEVFTNCSTSATSFLKFNLLLNGSGVGRCYDDDMMLVDYSNMPLVVTVIDYNHKDVQSGEIQPRPLREVLHFYSNKDYVLFEVPDTREGWAQAIEKIEVMTYQKKKDTLLILDFNKVRPRGAPIGGMQGRPASGPAPLITAIKNLAALRDSGMPPWRSAMYADHYLSECVLVGGARRAARMATKHWRDKSIFDFIRVKSPIEFIGKTGPEIQQMRKAGYYQAFLWSSNNSVTVDEDFWKLLFMSEEEANRFENLEKGIRELREHARNVFNAVCEASYYEGTGEPGFINQDMLTKNDEGVEALLDGNFAKSSKYTLEEDTLELTSALAKKWAEGGCKMIVNPCGEVPLSALGGYCVIADVVPFHAGGNGLKKQVDYAEWDADAEDSFKVATRALIRTNLMDCLYRKEVDRTNRIGVGMTGFHEYAWARFGYGWKDIINETKSLDFWLMVSKFKRAVVNEAIQYSKELGVVVPHTDTIFKPAGSTSKLFGLTEGAHLPSMREFLRWVQFRNDDVLVKRYEKAGYPIKHLVSYSGTTIVGFPTVPTICSLGMGDKLVTAAEATPEEQYAFLRLLEKYWLTGVEEDGATPLKESGGQISYTLKYNPDKVSFEEFKKTLLEGQSTIRCCSVMPQADTSAYEYQPEQPITTAEFELISRAIREDELKEDVGLEHVDCASGACPISFGENSASK